MNIDLINQEHMSINLDKVMDYVDEYTIGIVGIMGITYTGRYDDIKGLNDLKSGSVKGA
jgi:glutamate decarboxylase